ncbi:pre-mRNA-splicing factor syf1 [Coemansia sp. RSA 2610]|nr:pre-mRNA-splicing factor syf1 [Coemansia sp. RSA 2610]
MDIDISDLDLQFEDDVLRAPYKLKAWLRYLDHKHDAPARSVSVIYERALKHLPGSYKLWNRYLLHRLRQLAGKNPLRFEDEFRKAGLCFERALLLLHKMPELWLKYIRFATRLPDVTQARRVCDRALRALPVAQHERVWRVYLRFARRVGGETADRVYARFLRVWPDQAESYVDYCVARGRWSAAGRQLVAVLNNPRFRSPRGTTEHQLWTRLADVLRAHAGKLASWDVERVMRDGIARFPEHAGALWAALAEWCIARGAVDQARDVYAEAVRRVTHVRDFALVFDAYAEFCESVITAEMEHQVAGASEGVAVPSDELTDLRLAQLERLMDQRPFLVNDVVLRQNKHSVNAWLQRARLWQERSQDQARSVRERARAAAQLAETFERALGAVDAHKAADGTVADLWLAYAHSCRTADEQRAVLDRAVAAPMGAVAELVRIYIAYAELELDHGDLGAALRVLTRATAVPSGMNAARVDYRDESVAAAKRVFKSQKIWALLVDLYEIEGAPDSVRTAYERMIDLRIATPQTIVNYAGFLEEREYFEDSFRAYERGIAAFGYPVAIELWNIYLKRFVDRYGGSKLERARDLFEQALEKCPAEYAKPIYVAYGRLEETYGLARGALKIYERAARAVATAQRLEMYRFYVAKTAELLGVAHTRAVYERGIEELGDAAAMQLALEYAQTERQLGEIDRARALYAYASQYADPRVEPALWQRWHEFEVQHGNEQTFKEMLRVKRSVQAKYNTDAQFLAAAEVERQKVRLVKAQKPAQESAPDSAITNPDEVEIDDDDL